MKARPTPRAMLWLLVAALVVGLLVAGIRWLMQSGEWVEIDVPSSPHGEALRDPLYAAKQLARQLGASVSAPKSFEQLPPDGTTLVLASPRWNMFPGRAAALAQWVERGGRLVLLQSAMSERAAPPWLPLRLAPMRRPTGTAGDGNLPAHDDDEDDEPAAEDTAASAAPRPPPPESPVPAGLVPGRFATACLYYREPEDTPVFAFGEQRSFQVCGYASRRLLGQRRPEWQIDAPDGSVAMRVPLGRGSVTASTIEGWLNNSAVLRHDAPLAFAAVLQLRPGDVVWFVDEERRERLLALLWSNGKPALLLAAAALCLALWRGGVRFGPLIAEAPRARRSIGEQVRRTAAFIAAGGGLALHRAAVRALEEQARRSVPHYASLTTLDERSGAIARRIGADAAALASAMGAPAPAVRRPALTAAIAVLEHARRALMPARGQAPSRISRFFFIALEPEASMSTPEPEHFRQAAETLQRLRDEIAKAMVGQREAVELLLIAIVASGHVLIEGVPGLGKTLLARALSHAIALRYARVQFTPDMLPSDITGHAVLDAAPAGSGGVATLRVRRGPVFTNILLADEINRAPAKTQAALLEVMQEYQVTLEGETLALERPFFVLATQNPVETEGTYPLPEAQLDRFLLKIEIGYPTHADEAAIVVRTTQGHTGERLPLDEVAECIDGAALMALQDLASQVRVDERVLDYAVRIGRATRGGLGLAAGSGPRGAIAMVRAARAAALLQGRDFVTPDDVKRCALPALRHRVLLAPDAQLEGRGVDELLASLLATVDAPRL